MGSGWLHRQRRTHTTSVGVGVGGHTAGKDHMTPTSGPFLNMDTEVPKPKPNFIYTHPKAHELGPRTGLRGEEAEGHRGL